MLRCARTPKTHNEKVLYHLVKKKQQRKQFEIIHRCDDFKLMTVLVILIKYCKTPRIRLINDEVKRVNTQGCAILH